MKKVISVALVACMMGVLMQVSGETSKSITYDSAKSELITNNRTIKMLEIEERKMFSSYSTTVQSTRNLETEGVTVEFAGKEYFFEFDNYTKLNLGIMKDHLPQEMKYYWSVMDKNREVTKNSLVLGLRDLYLGLMKADKDVTMAQRKYALAQNKDEINKIKFKQGLITKYDLDESAYELVKAQKSIDEASRTKENMTRSLNSLVGVDINTEYDEIVFDELKRDISIKSVEYYVEKALAERLDIVNTQEEIRLKNIKKEKYENSKLLNKNYEVTGQYEDLLLELEVLNVKLEKTKFDIENEIKAAYIEVKDALNDLESTEETINMQKRTFDKLKAQYEAGFIARIVLDEVEIGIAELENAKELVIYSCNTNVMRLEQSAGIGPAY